MKKRLAKIILKTEPQPKVVADATDKFRRVVGVSGLAALCLDMWEYWSHAGITLGSYVIYCLLSWLFLGVAMAKREFFSLDRWKRWAYKELYGVDLIVVPDSRVEIIDERPGR